MANKHNDRMQKLREGLADMGPNLVPVPKPLNPPQPKPPRLAEPTSPMTLRLADSLKAKLLNEAARRTAEQGKMWTAQAVILDLLEKGLADG